MRSNRCGGCEWDRMGVFALDSLQGFGFGWPWLVLMHLLVLLPQPRELGLSQAVSEPLVLLLLGHGSLHVLNIRGGRR